jgi:hypothetical protein
LKFSRQTVSLGDNTPHVKCSPSVVTAIADKGTIITSRGKTHCKSPFQACQLSVFFALTRNRVVKTVCSYSEVVLQTTKHTIVYPGSGPSLKVIALCLAV